MPIELRIFISSPANDHLSKSQLVVKGKVLDLIRDDGFEPQEFGNSGLPAGMEWRPDTCIEIMKSCQGAIVLGFSKSMMYLFNWDSIPGNDNVRLIKFLMQNFCIDWVKTAIIEKIDNGKTIKVSTEKNYLSLKLNDDQTELNLEIDDLRTDEFIVKIENSKLNIYLTVDGLPSEYNHYEGALAISLGLPLLVLADKNIAYRGIFSHLVSKFDDSSFNTRYKKWCEKVKQSRHVFLGYCSQSKSTANDIKDYLDILKVSYKDWAMDFIPGGTILDEIEQAAQKCSVGIFLFTRDDILRGKGNAAAPRDNVIFEAGYFARAKGREKTLIIKEDGAKMPADLGGSIYLPLSNRSDIELIKPNLKKFLDERL